MLARTEVLTPGRADRIVAEVQKGIDAVVAANNAGVEAETLKAWLDRGAAASRGKYWHFFERVAIAQGRGTAAHKRITVTIELPLRYTPHEAGTAVHRAQTRLVVVSAGRRGGKTQAGAGEFASRYVDDLESKLAGTGRWEGEPHSAWKPAKGKDLEPFLRYAVVAPTYSLLDEPRIALRRELGLAEHGGVILSQTDHVWWLVGGVRIDFLSGDRPERLVSHGYDGVWYDEGARLKREVWTDNMRPTLSDRKGWALWTTTPLGKNWFWEELWVRGSREAAIEAAAMRNCEPDDLLDDEYTSIQWTTADNTKLPHLAEEMEIARRQMPPAMFARNYLASFEAFEGQCFDFDGTIHVHIPPPRPVDIACGFDPGQRHPSSFSVVCRDGAVFREIASQAESRVDFTGDDAWRRRSAGDRSTWANRIWAALEAVAGSHWNRVPLFLPHDRPELHRAFRKYGFMVRPAFQAHEPAVMWMSVALHNHKFTCASLIVARQLASLRYPQKGESSTKLWKDTDDDVWDGLRYALSRWIAAVSEGKLPTPKPVPGWSLR